MVFLSERKIRIGNEEFKVLGSMQEIMAEVELKKAREGLTTDELLDRAPFRDRDEVIDTLRFLEGKGKVRYDIGKSKWFWKGYEEELVQ